MLELAQTRLSYLHKRALNAREIIKLSVEQQRAFRIFSHLRPRHQGDALDPVEPRPKLCDRLLRRDLGTERQCGIDACPALRVVRRPRPVVVHLRGERCASSTSCFSVSAQSSAARMLSSSGSMSARYALVGIVSRSVAARFAKSRNHFACRTCIGSSSPLLSRSSCAY